ncbi:hypothetical protein BTS2_0433 [Bacillus sp. TS-2]|nr:hypothetical protein BTS2_0433 [Bacillus sp. TS-2]
MIKKLAIILYILLLCSCSFLLENNRPQTVFNAESFIHSIDPDIRIIDQKKLSNEKEIYVLIRGYKNSAAINFLTVYREDNQDSRGYLNGNFIDFEGEVDFSYELINEGDVTILFGKNLTFHHMRTKYY